MTPEPNRTDPLTQHVARSPRTLGAVLAVIALLCLIPVAMFGRSAFMPPKADGAATISVHRDDHIAYTLGGVVAAIAAGLLAIWTFAQAGGDDAPSRTRARIGLLITGAVLGAILMLFGLALFVLWFESLTKWLNAGEAKEAPRVLIPVVVALFGAALMFIGSQPARAEERNNPLLRRLIYGANFGLGALMLLFALLAGNIVLAQRLPNKLDTTESGFYTLTETTKKTLANLQQTVTVYTNVTPDTDRLSKDIRRLLDSCQEVNPARFKVKTLSMVGSADKDEIKRLMAKFPQYDWDNLWVLLVAGEDEGQSAFLVYSDMLDRGGQMGRGGSAVFTGEGKLMREVLFLAENKTKAVVYFTQGHGELSVETTGPKVGQPGRTARALKEALEKNYIDVRSWNPEPVNPKVPDDASAVIVADPRSTFTPEEATALHNYMATTFANDRKGKLIILTSPFPNVDGKGVAPLGLENLLDDYSIVLGKQYMLSAPQGRVSASQILVSPSIAAVESGNPIAALIANEGVEFRDCRSVETKPVTRGAESALRAELLLASYPPGRRSWFDPEPPVDAAKQWDTIRRDQALLKKFNATDDMVPLGAIVTDSRTPRMVVIGSGVAFADGTPRLRQGPPPVNVVAAAFDWLRDRPSLVAINKPYQNYSISKTATGFRLFWLPVGLVLLAIAVAGMSVWIVRRK